MGGVCFGKKEYVFEKLEEDLVVLKIQPNYFHLNRAQKTNDSSEEPKEFCENWHERAAFQSVGVRAADWQ